MSDWTVHHGDVADADDMIDAPADAVLCDPPYGLGDAIEGDDMAAMLQAWLSGQGYEAVGGGFMGRDWDASVVDPPVWEAIRAVCKPGAFLASFGGTRTFDLQSVAQRLAGWEMRDEVLAMSWKYGSGFPKSHNVSKAIDKAGGRSRRCQAKDLKEKREGLGLSREDVAQDVGCTASSVRDWEEGRARESGADPEYVVPSEKYRKELKRLLDYSEDERLVVGKATDRRGDGTVGALGHSGELKSGGQTTKAEQWDGYGTALAPAHEPIGLWRKPTDQTFAECAVEEGCGALNIDGCRTGTKCERPKREVAEMRDDVHYSGSALEGRVDGSLRSSKATGSTFQGRWPTNTVLIHHPQCGDICHDSCHVRVMDEQSGCRTAGGDISSNAPTVDGFNGDVYGSAKGREGWSGYGDTGGASRFFPRFRYMAKAARSEREAGLFDRKPQKVSDGRDEPNDTAYQRDQTDRKNTHPCVKPIMLCKWLATLLLPPKRDTPRRILVPFSGSGSEMIGAMLAGWDEVVGIERDGEYCEIARQRLAWWSEHGEDAVDAHKAEQKRREHKQETGQVDLVDTIGGEQ